MTDEYVVVITTDENLLKSIQNATKMDVVHVTNHDSAKEKNYRRKIAILDPDTVSTIQEQLSTWHDNAHHLIVLLDNHDDDFIEQNQEFISDVWFKPVNPVLLEKRLLTIQRYVKTKYGIPYYMQFAGTEISTPLGSIRGYTEVLLSEYMGTLTDEQYQTLQTIRNTAERLHRLMNDLRDWAKIEFDEFVFNFENINLLRMLDEISKLKELSASKTPKRLYPFELELLEKLPVLHADKSSLYHAITNILYGANDNKSTETKMKIWHKDSLVHIAISSENEFIWLEPEGFRLLSTSLGTEIVTYIIEKHGGEIFVETSPETGSTFHFTIPIAKDTDE